jgi:hypothetical protein
VLNFLLGLHRTAQATGWLREWRRWGSKTVNFEPALVLRVAGRLESIFVVAIDGDANYRDPRRSQSRQARAYRSSARRALKALVHKSPIVHDRPSAGSATSRSRRASMTPGRENLLRGSKITAAGRNITTPGPATES